VALPRVRQPLLVVQPMLDQEVPPRHGEQLAQLARSRPRAKVSDYVQAAGVNHLLTSATTGDVAEYSTLPQKIVNAPLMNDISSWLTKTLPPEPPK
jgi:fermentation-respiration switch protein FrsA (DUF1100 family)